MRRLAGALFALATLALGAVPISAHAADITKEQRAKGMKDAPAVVQKAGVPCTVTDAYFLGDSNSKDGKQSVYEVACKEGMGYVLLSGAAAVKPIDCLAASSQPSIACKLPANADPKQGLKPDLVAAGQTCTPTNARYIGANTTLSVYEVACQEGEGYILQKPVAAGGTPTAVPCIQQGDTGNMACTLTTKAQNDAYLANLARAAGKTCQISGSRYIGSDKTSGVAYYELGCGAQPGFIIATNKAGAYDRTVSCAQAKPLGGCTLTSAEALAAADTATYTQRAKAAGFNCDVSKYRAIGQDPNHDDVVELACSNTPEGRVAVIPADTSKPAHFVDCVRAGQFGDTGMCTLSTPTAEYAKYTAALAAKGRTSCKVSGAHYLGRSGSGTDFVETACSDGKPGYVLELTPSDQIKGSVLSCGQAKSAGLTCTLPTNRNG